MLLKENMYYKENKNKQTHIIIKMKHGIKINI